MIAGSEVPDLLIRNLIVLETQVESIPGDLRRASRESELAEKVPAISGATDRKWM